MSNSHKLEGLTPEFSDKVITLIDVLQAKGVAILVYEGLRSLKKQATLWKVGRTPEQVKEKITFLLQNKAHFLADILHSAPIGEGKTKVTNAICGEGFHNYGEAVDSVPLLNGKADWNNDKAFKIYATEAVKLGMDAGYFWKSFPDKPHVQLRPGRIKDLYNLPTIKHINDYWRDRSS